MGLTVSGTLFRNRQAAHQSVKSSGTDRKKVLQCDSEKQASSPEVAAPAANLWMMVVVFESLMKERLHHSSSYFTSLLVNWAARAREKLLPSKFR
jgi:hypothetical protein